MVAVGLGVSFWESFLCTRAGVFLKKGSRETKSRKSVQIPKNHQKTIMPFFKHLDDLSDITDITWNDRKRLGPLDEASQKIMRGKSSFTSAQKEVFAAFKNISISPST